MSLDSFLFGLVGFFVDFVDGANHEKNDKGDNKEVYNILDEYAVADVGGGSGTEDIGDGDFEVCKIDATDDETDERHDDIVDKAGDNFADSTTDDNAYG